MDCKEAIHYIFYGVPAEDEVTFEQMEYHIAHCSKCTKISTALGEAIGDILVKGVEGKDGWTIKNID